MLGCSVGNHAIVTKIDNAIDHELKQEIQNIQTLFFSNLKEKNMDKIKLMSSE